VPAEVSKRGVMMFNFEGALSSRPKRTKRIIADPQSKIKRKISYIVYNLGKRPIFIHNNGVMHSLFA
jgi:hypothetical protein